LSWWAWAVEVFPWRFWGVRDWPAPWRACSRLEVSAFLGVRYDGRRARFSRCELRCAHVSRLLSAARGRGSRFSSTSCSRPWTDLSPSRSVSLLPAELAQSQMSPGPRFVEGYRASIFLASTLLFAYLGARWVAIEEETAGCAPTRLRLGSRKHGSRFWPWCLCAEVWSLTRIGCARSGGVGRRAFAESLLRVVVPRLGRASELRAGTG